MAKVSSNLEALLKKASEGDAETQFELGEYYAAKDNVQSFNWYKEAADQGLLDAMYILAYLYEEGLGVKSDCSKAFELYARCAEYRKQGNSEEKKLGFYACKDIAIYYLEGKGRDKDLSRAVYWFEQAAMGIELEANEYHLLGQYYETNQSVKKDWKKVVHWYEKAADYKSLAKLYQDVLPDVGKARYYEGKHLSEKERMGSVSENNSSSFLDVQAIVDKFMRYYREVYPSEIQSVCNLKLMTDHGDIPFARDLGRNLEKKGSKALTEHSCFFLVAVYLRSLMPQVVGKVVGKPYLYDTFMSTGWPWLGCGSDELLNPIHIIRKARLFPVDVEVNAFLFIFSRVKRFVIDEFLTFLRGNQPNLDQAAYDRLVNATSGSLWDIERECWVQTELFECWIKDPLFPYELKLI